jgi:hypothetical protein
MIPESVIVPLNSCSDEDYCNAFSTIKKNGFWWYLFPSILYGNYSIPYKTNTNEWVFNVKPGLAWAVDFFKEYDHKISRKLSKNPLGLQVPIRGKTNSQIGFNIIQKLQEFDDDLLDPSKPRAIRKSLRKCSLKIINRNDDKKIHESLLVWNSLVRRTGWKKQLTLQQFQNSWYETISLPGTSIIACIDNEKDIVIGWLIAKLINNIAYIDTIASHSDFLGNRPNDLMVYSFIRSAQKNSNITIAHYSLVSQIKELERFKKSMGFKPVLIPVYSDINQMVSLTLRYLFKGKYNRMMGNNLLDD